MYNYTSEKGTVPNSHSVEMCVSTDGNTYNAFSSIFAEAEVTVVDIHGAIVSLETQGTHTQPTIHLILHGTETDTGLASNVLHNACLHKTMQHMQQCLSSVHCMFCRPDKFLHSSTVYSHSHRCQHHSSFQCTQVYSSNRSLHDCSTHRNKILCSTPISNIVFHALLVTSHSSLTVQL